MGGYERDPAPWSLDGIPPDFNGKLLEEDWPASSRCSRTRSGACRLEEMDVRLINGPEAFTPDGEFILGPTDVRGFWVAAGFCAHGLAGAAGWASSSPSGSSRGRRASTSGTWTPAASAPPTPPRIHARAHDRGLLDLLRRQVPRPRARGGRPLRLSPAYPRLQELGAAFGEKSGWERANWFEPNAAAGDEGLRPRGWAGHHWSPAIGEDTAAARPRRLRRVVVREDRGLAAGRRRLLEWLCDNRVARDVGAITYTQMLNGKGGIECDFTVTRLEERFRIVTGTAFGRHDLAWIRQHAPTTARSRSTTSPRSACIGSGGRRAARSSRR